MKENSISEKTSFLLPSRYADIKTKLEFYADKKAVITTNSNYIRTTSDEEKILAIDFEGGPFLAIGNSIKGNTIKHIKAAYIIEFE